jgi:hypothetical protein
MSWKPFTVRRLLRENLLMWLLGDKLKEFAEKAPYIKPYLVYLIQKWDTIPVGVRKHLEKELPELDKALNSLRVRAYVGQALTILN